ncbi:MAG: acyl-homoserine-lactone synthase, partial [Pseudomonadota bacterium]
MQNATFRLPDLHHHGSAYFEYLGLRKRFFVDELNWDIPHNQDYEMDQYDNPNAYYSLAIYKGKVVGGVRLMPTDTTFGTHTYMLRDALHAKIDGIPTDILASEVISSQVWEMTRLVIDPDLTTSMERNACLSAIGEGLHKIAEDTECQEFVGLTAPNLARVLRRVGYVAENVGQTYTCRDDGRTYGVMRIPVAQEVYAMA